MNTKKWCLTTNGKCLGLSCGKISEDQFLKFWLGTYLDARRWYGKENTSDHRYI